MKNKIIFLITVLIFFTGCTEEVLIENDNNEEIVKEEVVEPKEYRASLIMVGDCLVHEAVYNDAYEGDGVYNFTPLIEETSSTISGYDLAYYNQEAILGGIELGLSGYPRFNSPRAVGDAFLEAGFNVVSLANNHTLDKNEEGVINSLEYWSDKEVVTSGSYNSFEDQNNIIVQEKNNIKYAFLAYTQGTNGLTAPTGKEYLVNVYSDELVKEHVDSVRDKADVVIVSIHWGSEYQHEPNSYQREKAEYLSSLGVDIIIGTHPHVAQPIEYINDTLVIYSLGNFISTQIGEARLVGLTAAIDIVKIVDGENEEIKLENLKADFTYNYYDSRYSNIKIIPFSKITTEYLENHDTIYDKYKEIVSKYNDEIEFGIYEK